MTRTHAGESVVTREADEDICCIELGALPSTAFWARRLTKAALGAWQVQPDLTDTAVLMVSELVANAIVHQAGGAGPRGDAWPLDSERISLTLRHAPGQLVVEVFDASSDPPVLADAGPEAESGRGLMLVHALSKEWSFFLVPSGGKVTYCVVEG